MPKVICRWFVVDDVMAEGLTLDNVLGSKVDVGAARFEANRAAMMVLMGAVRGRKRGFVMGVG